jgi:uncharacterized protein (TIGR00290 family)
MQKAIYNWSGGKDSSFALMEVLKDENISIEYLLTSMSAEHRRISMHGVAEFLLDQQAENLNLPLRKIYLNEDTTLDTYNSVIGKEMEYAKSLGVTTSIFGDIFLEDLREFREKQLASVGLAGYFPIWKRNTLELVRDFIDSGFKAVIVSANARLLDESFCGRIIDHDFINDLPGGVDPCGENGEFHSFVFDGPIFSKPINIEIGKTIKKKYNISDDVDSVFWYTDLK